jgi:hypothetical protein
MGATPAEGPSIGALRSAEFTVRHHRSNPDGTLEEHEGGIDQCSAPECQWPQLGVMVTAMGATEMTGTVKERGDASVRVETASGEWYWRPLDRVRRPDWGVYCPHGTKLVEAIPAEHTCHLPKQPCEEAGSLWHLCIDHQEWCKACYPDGRKILPWPCTEEGCTEAAFDREQREMEEAYYEEMRQSYYG